MMGEEPKTYEMESGTGAFGSGASWKSKGVRGGSCRVRFCGTVEKRSLRAVVSKDERSCKGSFRRADYHRASAQVCKMGAGGKDGSGICGEPSGGQAGTGG